MGNLVKLNENINTKYWESYASVSDDGKTLYFTSNRPGGYGELDIYKSVLGKDGQWGLAMNLGPAINTKYNDDAPVITSNGQLLYFSSLGHGTTGGYDIFFSEKDNMGIWKKPVNIGYPINTTDDNLYFYPFSNGNFGLFAAVDEKGFGRFDIMQVEVFSAKHPKFYNVLAEFVASKDLVLPKKLTVRIVDKKQQQRGSKN
ncbi:MAG: hypothetical protein HC896_10140 [Bacteroidales bacterium]|nr:hypothetical protein [Bacteroidales bacterium]